jgi:hypothetical protein
MIHLFPLRTEAKEPQRFFGPLKAYEARFVADRMLDDNSFYQTIVDFLSGDIETRELCYEIQTVAESSYTTVFFKEKRDDRYE